MATQIHIGTASWQEPDFIEYWYPKGLKKAELLPYYAEHFDFVEVNGTFYGIPEAKITEQWCRQTPDNFVFTVKLHRLLSRHATEAKFLPPDLRMKADIVNGKVDLSAKMEKLVAKRFLQGIQPIIDAGKLGGLLLQLAPSFGPQQFPLEQLDHVLGLFAEFPIAVELRNRHWMTGFETPEQAATQFQRTKQFFVDRKITFVSVDAPSSTHVTVMPSVDIVTNPAMAYIRLHGRNEEAYVTGKTVQARFDYDYGSEELVEFTKRVAGVAGEVKLIFVVFNNNRQDFAPKAALLLREYLRRQLPGATIVIPRRGPGQIEMQW